MRPCLGMSKLAARNCIHAIKKKTQKTIMTVPTKISAMAGTGSLAAASHGQGCTGPERDPVRSCHRGELRKRRRKKSSPKKEEDFRVGTMNVGTMRGRSAEVVETADRRKLDVGFLQETRWKGAECQTKSCALSALVRCLKAKNSVYKVF